MDKVKTIINQQTYKEIYKKTRIQLLILTIIGLIMSVAFFLITIFGKEKKGFFFIISIVGTALSVFLLIYGTFFSFIFANLIRKAKDENREAECTFYDEYIEAIGYQDGEQTDKSRYYYKNFVKFSLTTNYIVAIYKPSFQVVFTRNNQIIKLLEDKGIPKKKI